MAIACCVWSQEKQEDKPVALKLMTFNLRYASQRPPHAWPQRRPVMRQLISLVSPDIFGTQEGLYQQLKDIAADVPEYSWIGTGRDGGSRGEFMAIFYKKERFEPLEYDHFWLSDTPEVIGSSTWGNTNRRMVTWVRFQDRPTKREFYIVNTHLDHEIEDARQKAAKLIRQRIDKLKPEMPLMLIGDFNSAPSSAAYNILTEDKVLIDSWFAAADRRGEQVGTFHDYKGPMPGGTRIDWILTRGNVTTDSTEIITFSKDGEYPSDHFPVVATVKF
jgi:endonuclease/exonuclease/phosphatase family metal-dependent hydrolase